MSAQDDEWHLDDSLDIGSEADNDWSDEEDGLTIESEKQTDTAVSETEEDHWSDDENEEENPSNPSEDHTERPNPTFLPTGA